MSFSVDQEIEHTKKVLEQWRLYALQIDQVRQLEQNTMFISASARQQGYQTLDALRGYGQLISAFQLIGDISKEQKEKLSQVTNILGALEKDRAAFGKSYTPEELERYSRQKREELLQKGEVYMLTGHNQHFNVTKITRQKDGSYTYTLYDAGHETNIVDLQNDRHVVNAVQEMKIRNDADMRKLIETALLKKSLHHQSDAYHEAKSFLESSLEEKPVRVEREYGQRRGNCTTRGQRILAADILRDPELSEKLYDFASGLNGASSKDIRQWLEHRLGRLEEIKAGATGNPGLQDVISFVKGSDRNNYQTARIGLDGGDSMSVYRTVPGALSEGELHCLQSTMQRNGVEAMVRESISQPGQFYLYVPVARSAMLGLALENDQSLAAELYRKHGADAPLHLETAAVKSFDAAGVIADVARWQAAETSRENIVRIAVGEMQEDHIRSLEDALAKRGISAVRVTSTTMGPTLRVAGDDIAKLTAWQQELSVPVHEKVLTMGYWRDALDNNGRPISRIATNAMPEEQVQKCLLQLREAGLHPEMAQSDSHGMTIRLSGEDAVVLQEMRRQMILGADWQQANKQDGTTIARVAVSDMKPEKVTALIASLEAEGFKPKSHLSETLGMTIRLSSDDAKAVMNRINKAAGILDDTPPPSAPEQPKANGGRFDFIRKMFR